MAAPPARLLDLTRLISRAGRVLTGVDRVELAYLRALLARADACFGLVRTAIGYVLLDRAGMTALAQAVTGGHWGPPDWIARVSRLDPGPGAAQAMVRGQALARCLPPGLARMLRRHLPDGTVYLNTGHSNLTARVLQAAKQLPGGRVSVLINSLGATPAEELYILYARCAGILAAAGVDIVMPLVGRYATSMEMTGATITICHLDAELEALLTAPCDCAFWRV